MNFTPEEQVEKSPYSQLLIIALYALIGLIFGTILSIGLLILLYGSGVMTNGAALSGGDPAFAAGLKIAQVFTTVCTFLAPPLLLARKEKTQIGDFYQFRKPKLSFMIIIITLMICSTPVMEWIALANQKMVLPGFLHPIENWMHEKEDEAMKMTLLLLRINNAGDFLIDLLVIALLPAIAEELLFRGAVQRAFTRMFHHPHIAIWLSAFIFSAIHVQFFGFFPRLLLGAAFGYIYLWTGSLWYAMFAHFLNNGFAVCQAWYLQAHHIPLEQADNTSNFPWYGYVISLILTILLFTYLKAKTTTHNGKQLG